MLQADDESLDSRRHAIYFRSQYCHLNIALLPAMTRGLYVSVSIYVQIHTYTEQANVVVVHNVHNPLERNAQTHVTRHRVLRTGISFS